MIDGKTARRARRGQLDETPAHGTPRDPSGTAAFKPLVPGMRRLLFVAAVLVLLAGFQLFVFTGRTGTFFAWTIANGRPHELNEPFSLERFTTGALIDEHGAAGVAH